MMPTRLRLVLTLFLLSALIPSSASSLIVRPSPFQPLPAYTRAGLPTAGLAGRLARVTDDVRGLATDLSDQWLLENTVRGIPVEWFGAKGDGTTDDTAAFVAALSASATEKITVIASAPNYRIATGASLPLIIPVGGKLTGFGTAQSKLTIASGLSPVGGITSLSSEATISDLTIDYTGNAADGIKTPVTVSRVRVERVRLIATLSGKPIWVRTGTDTTIKDNIVDTQGVTSDIGIYLDGSPQRALISGNTILMLQQLGGLSAIRSDGGSFIRIEANHATGGNILHFAGGAHNTAIGNIVNNASGDGISLGTAFGNPAQKYAQIIGNTCTGSTDYCFSLTNSQYMTFMGNTARNASTGGFGFVDSKYNTIIGNVAINNGQQNFVLGGDTVRNGFLFFEGGAGRNTQNTIIGNIAIDDQGVKTQKQGINVTGTATHSLIMGNTAFNNGLSQIVTTANDIVMANRTSETGNIFPTETASSLLDYKTAKKAWQLPQLTTTERDALTAVNGMIIYNTTTGTLQGFAGAWINL